MNGEIEPPKRLRLIFRVLSALTLLEGAVGFLLAADNIAMRPMYYRALQHLESRTHPSAGRLIYIVASVNVVFNLVLLYAGALLWKQRRRGLLVLTYSLIAELLCVLALTIAMDAPASMGYAVVLGIGLTPFAIQVATGFPIVAGVLIFFAYRYLGIPARPTG